MKMKQIVRMIRLVVVLFIISDFSINIKSFEFSSTLRFISLVIFFGKHLTNSISFGKQTKISCTYTNLMYHSQSNVHYHDHKIKFERYIQQVWVKEQVAKQDAYN